MGGNPYEGGATSFQTSIAPGGRYRVSFDGATPQRLRIALRYMNDADRLDLDLPAPKGAFRIVLNRHDSLGERPVDGTSVRRENGRVRLQIAGHTGKNPVVEIVAA